MKKKHNIKGYIVYISFFFTLITFSQKTTFPTVTERSSATDRGSDFNSGNEITQKNSDNNGSSINNSNPLFITGNSDHLGITLDNAAMRFDIDYDALDSTPSSLLFVYPKSGIPYFRRIGHDHTILKLWSPTNTNHAYESTLALVNGDGEESILDLYNMDYPSNQSFGIRLQKRRNGKYKPFHFEYSDGTNTYPVFTMNPDKSSYFYGDLGIGTKNSEGHKLAVAGKIMSEEIIVKAKNNNWPDYVFKKEYNLMPIDELEDYIVKHKRLPKLPSSQEAQQYGIELGKNHLILIEKIQELTLYILNQDKKIKELEKKIIQLNDTKNN